MTRLITCLALGLLLFVGYEEWHRKQVEASPASVSVSPPPPTTVMPASPAEAQLSQPTQPTIALSNPPEQQPTSLQTAKSSVDARKLDGQGEKPKLSRYEIPFEAYEGTAKRIIISVTFNDSVTALMVLDTGATGMLISSKLAQKLGVFSTDEGTLLTTIGGIGGPTPAIHTIIDKVQVGGASDRFIPTKVIRPISDSWDGLVGMDFMAKYSMTVNHKKGVLVFEEIPPDPNSAGGHDEQWWRSTFQEFNNQRDAWEKYSEEVEKLVRDDYRGPYSPNDIVYFKRAKRFAEWQQTQADKLLGRLEHYASEYSVPREWR